MSINTTFVMFRIPYPRSDKERKRWNREYGLNAYYAGKQWSKRKDDAALWHALTRSALSRQGLTKARVQGPVQIVYRWNDGLDIENHAAMGKMRKQYARVHVWTMRDNFRARFLFDRYGFRRDGAQRTADVEGHTVDVIRLTWTAAEAEEP